MWNDSVCTTRNPPASKGKNSYFVQLCANGFITALIQ